MAILFRSRAFTRWLRSAQSVRWTSSASGPFPVRYGALAPHEERLKEPSRTLEETQQSNLNDFYSHHLRQHVRLVPLLTYTWTTSLSKEASKLSPTLSKDPMALFVKGQEADLELAATCLEAVIASTIRTSASKEEERLEYMRKKPGTRALSWFFSGAFEKHNIVLGQRFMRALVYCMVAEQGMKHLWEWMSIEDMRRFVQSWTLRDASHWRGNLLRYLVESAAHWANEDRPGLEEAMLIFSQAVDRHDPRREPVSLHAARIWLVRQLCVYDLKGVDPRIFDEFVVAAKVPPRRGGMGLFDEFAQARLQVSHPEQPQADSAVALLRRWRTQGDQDMGLRVLLADESGNNGKHSVYCFVLRTAQALQSQQKLVEAKEVLNIGRQLLPSYFQGMTP